MRESHLRLRLGLIPFRKKKKSNYQASLIAQLVKNPPAMQEIQVQFLGREDPPEKEMATHSSVLAWRTPWTEESGRLESMGSQGQTQLSD